MDYNEALARLASGNKRFFEQKATGKNVSADEREKLLNGQQPYAVIICCSDSRVSPEVVFDVSLNELFVIRNAGNVVTAIELASLEYALMFLNVPLVVVLGHENCGAVSAVCQMVDNNDFSCGDNMRALVNEILPSAKKGDNTALVEYENIRHTKNKLMENHVVKELIAKKEVSVVTAKYKLLTGEVEFFD